MVRSSNLSEKHLNICKQILFIHIPKCAGTSISALLGLEKSYHTTATEANVILRTQINKYKSLAIVRDPIDRFISNYNYARMKQNHHHNNSLLGKIRNKNHQDHEILQKALLDDAVILLLQNKLKHNKYWNHWAPQSRWILDANGNILVNTIIPITQLNIQLPRLLSDYNIPFEKIEVLNSSNHNLNALSDESVKLLKQYYKSDYDLFEKLGILNQL